MTTEIVVTLKAGTGYDAPWIVFHADGTVQMEAFLENAAALGERAAYAAKLFSHAWDTTPSSYTELLKKELGATVISVEPGTPVAPVVPTFSEPANADAPWNRPAPAAAPWSPPAPAGGGWTPPAPAESNVYLIEVPRDKMDAWSGPKGPDGKAVKGGGIRGQLQAGGIKIDWDATAKRNTVPKDADPGALDYIRSLGIELK